MSKLFLSERIFIDNEFHDGGVLVNDDGKIGNVFDNRKVLNEWNKTNNEIEIIDFANLVLMPGLIDSHVHINEPGRTEWEGFETATRAAAAGGFTTIVDMPLNSIPPTTTVRNLLLKQNATNGKIFVDVGFWGGIIPGNENDLAPLLSHGIVGFKCFLCPSGVEEFPNVTEQDVELAYQKLENLNALIAFHAEKCDASTEDNLNTNDGNPKEYNVYLKTRPASFEVTAIEMVCRLAEKYDTVRSHIVHLSAADAVPLLKQCRQRIGHRLSVETCYHYLTLAAEDVPDGRVDFKCCPPIRNRQNQVALWKALQSNDINMIVSDHSPSTSAMKLLTEGPDHGNFLKSWGGIASIQFGLSLFWTHCRKYQLHIKDMMRLMCEEPAKLCGYDNRKGKIAKGYDADFCVWDPNAEFIVTPEIVEFRNTANPYMGQKLCGSVHATIVRGKFAYRRSDANKFHPVGTLIKRKK